MKVSLFNFHLPEGNIAMRPAAPRESARLLHICPPDGLTDYHVGDLPALLLPGDALVFNDTKVIPARLSGIRRRAPSKPKDKKETAETEEGIAHIQVTLHMRAGAGSWRAFVKPARRLKQGEEIIFAAAAANSAGQNIELAANAAESLIALVEEKGEAGEMLLRFNRSGAELDAAIARFGYMPLPPYIAARRREDAQDKKDYQTIYAREEGAVAAPTAGLHFTPALLAALQARGVESHFITLHVGAGTFLPVKAADTKDHKMHSEIGAISAETAAQLQAVKARGGKIIAVGTTALRLLESAADAEGRLQAWQGATDIFITPGYRFKYVDRLMTNFHLPQSTLFMLTAAFSGLELMQKAYAHAVQSGYRFYSYGDASLLDLAQEKQS